MSVFDSVNYALTLSSGGFGTTDGGVMAFSSARIEVILMVFMVSLYQLQLLHLVLVGKSKEAFKDGEVRSYLFILIVAWIAMAFNIYSAGSQDLGFLETIRHSMFQAISISSTGYSSADFATWPLFSQFVLLFDDNRSDCRVYRRWSQGTKN